MSSTVATTNVEDADNVTFIPMRSTPVAGFRDIDARLGLSFEPEAS